MALEILTAALVLVTASYAISTYRIVRANEAMSDQMRAQMEDFNRPLITASIFTEADNPIFYLLIANRGRTAAKNLHLSMTKSFQRFGEPGESKDISKFPVFRNGICSFPPGSELIFGLAQGFVIFEDDTEKEGLPWVFSINTEYYFGNQKIREEHLIDLSGYRGAAIPQDPIVRKLKDIDKTLQRMAKEELGDC